MSNDFFSKFDAKLKQIVEDDKQQQAEVKAAVASSAGALNEMYLIAKEYQAGLSQRRLQASIDKGTYSLSFSLKWGNGGPHALEATVSQTSGSIDIFRKSTDEKQVAFRSTDAVAYRAGTVLQPWREKLEELIESYITQAARHGGLPIRR